MPSTGTKHIYKLLAGEITTQLQYLQWLYMMCLQCLLIAVFAVSLLVVCSGSTFELAIPVWALAPIILGCLLVLGILILILIKIIFTILVSCMIMWSL